MRQSQLNLGLSVPVRQSTKQKRPPLHAELARFSDFGTDTVSFQLELAAASVPVYVNEFWTARQRQAHSVHEISYRACFKPQLPRFFIERLTEPGDVVYDPFMGRGTTPVEAALLDRIPYGCDINPLSERLTRPRFTIPQLSAVEARLRSLDLTRKREAPDDLLAFYHPHTLTKIANLRDYLENRQQSGELDAVDDWIRMVATNRLTGHSPGFFSVYTMPPNQAVSAQRQLEINAKRKQTPPDRDVIAIIMKKSRTLLSDMKGAQHNSLERRGSEALLLTKSCDDTPEIPDASVNLVVTSPPFLAVVNYQLDNWLRSWFNGIDAAAVPLWKLQKPEKWQAAMEGVFRELARVLVPDGHVAFEVGELRHGKLKLEELAIPAALRAGLSAELVLINDQVFTKTSNCWGIDNQTKGTNTNRIALLKKPA